MIFAPPKSKTFRLPCQLKSPVIPNSELINILSLTKSLFSKEILAKAVGIPPAERRYQFLVNWQKGAFNYYVRTFHQNANVCDPGGQGSCQCKRSLINFFNRAPSP